MKTLEGKVAVITGAGRGIGRAEALRFAEEGCRVVVNDTGTSPQGEGTDPEVAQAVVREIEAAGGQAFASTHDISTMAGAAALVAAAVAKYGKVDILVTSATVIRDKTLIDCDDEAWDKAIDVNLRGTFACARAVAKHLVERNAPGRLILTSSIAGLRGSPGLPAYSAAKGGIYGLMCTAAQELQSHKITVNALSPLAYTRLTAEPMAGIPDAETHLSPRHVADVVVFLASDAAAEITGAVVEVQGAQVSINRMLQGTAALPRTGSRWTVDELRERWPEIAQLSRANTIAEAAALTKKTD
jgi:NAD(P)-dependent dehydrogenase (short-subunit alcohol dehydrogenase family)